MRLNCVGSSVLSAMTHTPPSRPLGLETTPPMSFSPIVIASASFCGCARAGTDTPASNAAAATSTGSLFPIFMTSSLAAPAAPVLFQQDLLDLRKIRRSDRADLTQTSRGVHRARAVWARAADVAASIEWPHGSTAAVWGRPGGRQLLALSRS